ncbi:MAG: hypothetical protein WCV79_02215 [Candidatus Paceibacterota bacterium]|jgi:hypothetical protein
MKTDARSTPPLPVLATGSPPPADINPQKPAAESRRLTIEEFAIRAIEKLAVPGKQTIHTVYSGFNDAFRKYFPGQDPIEETKKLVLQGKISLRLCRGGAVMGKPGVVSDQASPKITLTKMGL